MKKQIKSNLLTSLQSLGIIFVIFFALAFACNEPTDTPPPNSNNTKPSNIRDRVLTGNKKTSSDEITPNDEIISNDEIKPSDGRCSTEAEFREVITKYYEDKAEKNVIEKQVSFSSFEVDKPRRYKTTVKGRTIDTNSYQVTATFNLFRTVSESQGDYKKYIDTFVKSGFMCYIDSEDECFCIANENSFPVESPYTWKNK